MWSASLAKNKNLRILAKFVVAGLLLIAANRNLSHYFFEYNKHESARYVYCWELAAIAQEFNQLPENTVVYLYTARWSVDYETLRFLAPQLKGVNRIKPFGEFSLDADRSRNAAFALLNEYVDLQASILAVYPDGKVTNGPLDLNGKIAYRIIYIPKI